jgi:hypothetical protein
VPNSSDRARSRRARQIVQAIASRTRGTRIPGWSEPTHPFSRSRKTSFVYGGGNAASASEPLTPHGAISHVARPKIIPNPTDISDGPSSFSGGPRWNRLVSRRSPNTAISEKPKITHVVGCVNAAAMPTRNIALRAPHEVLAGAKNARINERKYRTVMLSR